MTTSFWERHFLLAATALLLVMTAAEVASMRTESQTYDEGYHLLCGYSYLKTGRVSVHSEHPPLAQIAAAWPLLFFDLRVPPAHPGDPADERNREQQLLYRSRYSADTLLLVTRSAHVLITLLLGGIIAWWMRREFGAAAALAALWLFVFDPNFLAHGRYATTDIPAAACFLVGCLAWNRCLSKPGLVSTLLCGVATGIAMATKYSAVLLFETYVVLYLLYWLRDPDTYRLSSLVKNMVVVAVMMFVVIFAAFGFEVGSLLPPGITVASKMTAKLQEHPETAGPMSDLILNRPTASRIAEGIVHMPIPAPSFFRGLYFIGSHVSQGHDTYLLGNVSKTGWWYYFPLIAAVKTPVGDLLLLLLGVTVAIFTLSKGRKTIRIEWFTLTIPPMIYFVAALCSHLNVGFRHLLPVYPFLFMWIAAVLFRPGGATRGVRIVAVVCLGLTALESMVAFPNYLAFFNALSGGMRSSGPIAVDSNLDWGQDLKRVKAYLAANGISNVCLGYFGMAPPDYYGIDARPVPSSLADARASGCVVVMSMSLLFERNFRGQYDWLLRLQPTGRIGDSFRVYEPGRDSSSAGSQ
jgi:4-amino-4-deoxy-L-arabinose transferase-like glycosyltransferase